IARGVRAYQAPRFGATPSCDTADRTLPYEFHFIISHRIFSYSFQTTTESIAMDITVRPTGGFTPRPSSGAWPPTLTITLKNCSGGTDDVDRASTVADGQQRSFTFRASPGLYFFEFRLASEFNVQGFGTIR